MEKEVKEDYDNIISEIGEVYKGNNWLIVKKYLTTYLKPKNRKLLSTRHHKSKKHTLNKFEVKLINEYEKKYKIKLLLKEEDTHKE